jgi:hypothetical protein
MAPAASRSSWTDHDPHRRAGDEQRGRRALLVRAAASVRNAGDLAAAPLK